MRDEIIMNTALTLTKNMCDILMHGAIESSTPKINKLFSDTLVKYINIQQGIFKAMEQKGFYSIETVPESKIDKIATKHEDKIC